MKNQSVKKEQLLPSELVKTEPKRIPFVSIQLAIAMFALREKEDYSDEAVKALAEDIAVNGIITPLLVAENPDETFTAIDCHRRFHAIQCNIERGVTGFTDDLRVPAHVIAAGASQRALLERAVAANVQRQNFLALDRITAAVRLHKAGTPVKEIARLLGVGETTVRRDLRLGEDSKWMQYVRNHEITATTAAGLLKAATEVDRLDELEGAFEEWLDRTSQEIYAEDARRKEDDESSLTLLDKQPQKYLTKEQVKAWLGSLKSGEPLGPAVFRYRAMVRREKGRKRLEVDRISADLEDLELEELAKVAVRIADLDAELRRELREKAQAEKRAVSDSEQVAGESPGRRLLRELGLNGILAESDDPEDEDAAEAEGEQLPPVQEEPKTMDGLFDTD